MVNGSLALVSQVDATGAGLWDDLRVGRYSSHPLPVRRSAAA
jgi:hypothetical protein